MIYRKQLFILICSIVAVFAPIKASLLVALILSLLDCVSGVAAALKQKQPITSTGLRRTLVKVLVYELIIMLAYITEQYMTGDLVPLTRILSGFIGITEFKSILENLEILAGMPILKLLINKISATEDKDE